MPNPFEMPSLFRKKNRASPISYIEHPSISYIEALDTLWRRPQVSVAAAPPKSYMLAAEKDDPAPPTSYMSAAAAAAPAPRTKADIVDPDPNGRWMFAPAPSATNKDYLDDLNAKYYWMRGGSTRRRKPKSQRRRKP